MMRPSAIAAADRAAPDTSGRSGRSIRCGSGRGRTPAYPREGRAAGARRRASGRAAKARKSGHGGDLDQRSAAAAARARGAGDHGGEGEVLRDVAGEADEPAITGRRTIRARLGLLGGLAGLAQADDVHLVARLAERLTLAADARVAGIRRRGPRSPPAVGSPGLDLVPQHVLRRERERRENDAPLRGERLDAPVAGDPPRFAVRSASSGSSRSQRARLASANSTSPSSCSRSSAVAAARSSSSSSPTLSQTPRGIPVPAEGRGPLLDLAAGRQCGQRARHAAEGASLGRPAPPARRT